ncbi:hypothetical protein [Mycolicibacterium llatzerense]|uniref:hypothetical protein n=1 Tax=Mycolicibacterium llatzerense TaxID=280871 RepID=UPI0021B5A7EC|nr:hypothetical protein [Mycolicibacterium llatzerense]
MTTALPGKPFRPRRSSIGQAAQTENQPVEQTPASTPAAATPPARPRPAAVVPPPSEPEPQPQARNKRIAGESKDILLSMPDVEKARMVNTIAHTTPRTGIKHQSKFIRYAVAKLCQELEDQYNNGEPFEAPAVEPI